MMMRKLRNHLSELISVVGVQIHPSFSAACIALIFWTLWPAKYSVTGIDLFMNTYVLSWPEYVDGNSSRYPFPVIFHSRPTLYFSFTTLVLKGICICMLRGSTHYCAPRVLSHHIVDFLGSRRMETAPTSIEVILRPTLVQSDEPSDLRVSLSPTRRHSCTHVLGYTAPGTGSPRRSPNYGPGPALLNFSDRANTDVLTPYSVYRVVSATLWSGRYDPLIPSLIYFSRPVVVHQDRGSGGARGSAFRVSGCQLTWYVAQCRANVLD